MKEGILNMDNLAKQASNYFSSDKFYSEAKKRINQCVKEGKNIFIATLDLDRFNYINDLFGYEIGDLVLQKLTNHFSITLPTSCIFSKIHADIFAFCLEYKDYTEVELVFTELTKWQNILQGVLPEHFKLTASGGIIIVNEPNSPISALLDKANYARQKAKSSSVTNFRFYDEKMNEQLQWQKIVTFSMEAALENHEFEMYLQPKVFIKNGHVVGAEALVRWRSPIHGLIPPDNFIPILEQNGFVRQLDFYMLEQACQFLKDSVKNGIPQISISVNFSKSHLSSDHLVDQIFQIVNRMGIDTSLIEIEFTESLSVESFEKLVEVASDLKLLGFKVSLDDFGSAYSSLNCLKDLPIDIIKIDKAFLNSSSNSEKGQLIIAKMIELIKSLRMLSVMEGVETREQVSFLQKMSCDFGQGFFYAKPMPTKDYIEYLKSSDILTNIQSNIERQVQNVDKAYLDVIPQEFQMDNWELYTLGKNIDMGLMKGYLNGDATVQYVNDRALEYLGYSRHEFREVFHNSIVAFTHPDDAAIILKNAELLRTTGKPLKFQTRAIRKDGKVIILQGRSSCVIDDHGRPIGLYAFQDVTEELAATKSLQDFLQEKICELQEAAKADQLSKEALRFSEERYRVIVEQSEDIMFDWDFSTDTIFLSDQYIKIFGQKPIMENLSTNLEIRERIHPDDLPEFEEWLFKTYRNVGHFLLEFRCRDIHDKYMWLRAKSTAICDSTGNAVRAVGLFSNIDALKGKLELLTFKAQRDSLTHLLNKEETKIQTCEILKNEPSTSGAFFMIDIDNFKELNDNLGHQLGDTVLVDFSLKIRDFFAPNSIVGRIGGDEIAVYVPGIELVDLAKKAEALIRNLRIFNIGSAAKYTIQASVGISCYPIHGKTFEELYHFADLALYVSKRTGRDKYTIYQHTMSGGQQDSRTPVEWTKTQSNNYLNNDILLSIFTMLYETKDINASIQMILELLGKRFKVDGVYVFQNDPNAQIAYNTHEWSSASLPNDCKTLKFIDYSNFNNYLSEFTTEGIYSCSDVKNAPSELHEICETQRIKSFLHCAIYHEGLMIGFIGFDMCNRLHSWTNEEIAILSYFSKILSIFLAKENRLSK